MNKIDCPTCQQLSEQFLIAVDKLTIASSKLAVAAARSGDPQRFRELLAESQSAKVECEHIQAQTKWHLARHNGVPSEKT